jgi:8-oxo-dGTP pyrophosphatase MutT (NUDIX family)
MRREFSAGAVLVRSLRKREHVAAIQPQGRPAGTWALPKGLVGAGESAEEAALRETLEETGVAGRSLGKLGDIRYVYTQTWGDAKGERVFKVVSFFLVRAGRGRIGEIEEAMRVEVAEARWLPLDEAPRLLAYKGEREMVEKALVRLAAG